jgi:hypothetical protein
MVEAAGIEPAVFLSTQFRPVTIPAIGGGFRGWFARRYRAVPSKTIRNGARMGPGRRDGQHQEVALRLVDTTVSSTGVVIHRYERAGALEYGSFEVDLAGSSSQLWSSGDAKQGGPHEQGDR